MRFSVGMTAILIGASIISVAAQKKTITNADLEPYRQARLSAEREYRESFERLGLPSPTELERRAEQSQRDSAELSKQLRQSELEREWMDVYRDTQVGTYPSETERIVDRDERWPGIAPAYYYPGYFVQRRGARRYFSRGQTGYAAGGQFWSVGPRTPTRPLIKIRRR